jgi:hypothetical protein
MSEQAQTQWVTERGHITREHTMWCGVCGNWEQVAEPTKGIAAKWFRRAGWKNTKENGWTCPTCLQQKR